MEQVYITNVEIKKVRHLQNISIPLSENEMKHLIFTGKNGSGKTSVIEELADYLQGIVVMGQGGEGSGLNVTFNCRDIEQKHSFLAACYKADRTFKAQQPKHVEKVQLKNYYNVFEFPRKEFVKYLLDLKVTEALARNSQKIEKAEKIKVWFEKLEQLLKRIFADETVKLEFDDDEFEFHILQQGKEPFDFHTLSSGYGAVLDVVLDIIMRMEYQTQRSFDFSLPGIVLIDEIETHLHLELQKNILPLLTAVFPNIQFIITSHSPFILNSIQNAVIYDLENHIESGNPH